MIDPDDYRVEGLSSLEIRELFFSLFDFVKENDVTNMYRIKERFPIFDNPETLEIIHAMVSQNILEYCPMGIRISGNIDVIPLVEDLIEDGSSNSISINDLSISDSEGFLERDCSESTDIDYLLQLEEMENRISKHLRSFNHFIYEDKITSRINSMRESIDKDILIKCFIDMCDISILLGSNGRAKSTIVEFCSSFECDPLDLEYFTKYDLPSNLFIYIFDRTPAYYRLLMLKHEPGHISPEVLIEDARLSNYEIHTSPGSENRVMIYDRFMEFITSYVTCNDNLPQNEAFVEAYMFVFNNYLVSRDDLYKSYYDIFTEKDELIYERNALDAVPTFDRFILNDRSLKYMGRSDALQLIDVLMSSSEAKYSVTIEKLFRGNKDDILSFYIDDIQEFEQFISKYCLFEFENEYICFNGSLTQSIINYIQDLKIYERRKIAKKYSKKFGGSQKKLLNILDDICIDNIIGGKSLSDVDFEILRDEFERHEWTSRINAESIFSHKHGLEKFFNNYNMHKLGFVRHGDVFHRSTYLNFRECLRANDFSGEDLYVDNRFKLNMESESFKRVLDYLVTNLMWVPVSESRYINLRSERFGKLYDSIKKYILVIREICVERFVTPFLLKNIIVGIEEIDDDDYDIIFYDSILRAAKVNRGSINKQHFYYINSASDEYRCTAPHFLKHIVSLNGKICDVDELKYILNTDYGIVAPSSNVRQLVSMSECIFSKETDTAYLDAETFKEVIKHE